MTNQSLLQDISSFTVDDITAASIPLPAWSIDFTKQSPASAGLTFTRASSAGYTNASGNWVTALTNTPRVAHHPLSGLPLGLMLEETRTNYLLNSTAPASQTISLSSGTYTLWLEGTGSCTCTAGSAIGSSFGTATAALPITFALTTAGTVVFTVSGSVSRFQCENSFTPSSFIATTGASATRSGDFCSLSNAPINPQQGSVMVSGTATALTTNSNAAVSLDNGSGGNATRLHAYLRTSPIGVFTQINNATVADLRQYSTVPANILLKMAFSYSPQGTVLVLNGRLIGRSETSSEGLACSALRVGHKAFGTSGQPNAPIQRVAYYNVALSTTQLQQITA